MSPDDASMFRAIRTVIPELLLNTVLVDSFLLEFLHRTFPLHLTQPRLPLATPSGRRRLVTGLAFGYVQGCGGGLPIAAAGSGSWTGIWFASPDVEGQGTV